VPGQVGELLPQPPGRDALQAIDEPGQCDGRGKVDEQVDVLGLAVELDQFAAEVLTDRRMITSMRSRWMAVNIGCRYFVTKPSGCATQIRSAGLYERPYLVA
jgi:hypothetical protein